MMRLMNKLLISLLFVMLPTLSLAATKWILVPTESQLTFTGTQNDAPVTGEFKKFSFDFNGDFNELSHVSLDVVIDMNSLTTSYGEFKKTLLTSDWFNVAKFPNAEFKSNEFTKGEDSNYVVKGTLTIRDKSMPLVFNFTADFSDPKKAVFVGKTIIKRRDFGVGQGEWASVDAVKDDVTVNFKVVATKG